MKKTISLILIFIFAVLVCASCQQIPTEVSTPGEVSAPSDNSSDISEVSEYVEPERNLQAVAIASIGSSGDILVHNAVRTSGYDSATGTFDFSYAFQHLAPYVSNLDYAVVNAEFSVSANGTYSSLPFRIPSEMVKALADCGYDMGTTANNHIADGGTAGMKKTMTTLTEYGMDYTGTRLNAEDSRYLIKDINGIKVGFLNYSYGAYWNTNCFNENNLEAF